jgi:predicted SprT family Zn-dependent metalloprotease
VDVFSSETNRIFVRHREEISRHLFNVFNAQVFSSRLPSHLPLIWSSDLRTTAGRWSTRRHLIELSVKVLDSYTKLRDTLIHEMCHAAVTLLDQDPSCVHGPKWKLWTKKAMKCFPSLDIGVYHTYEINFKYKYECAKCKKTYGRHSKPINVDYERCGVCEGHLEEVGKGERMKRQQAITSYSRDEEEEIVID